MRFLSGLASLAARAAGERDVTDLPASFLLGAATSSHQVEGDTANDWTDWERDPRHLADAQPSGRACGWWGGRAEEDLALAASLGHDAHRMSLEWSRLEPEPGRYDAAAFARYRGILEAGRRAGLRMFVTVNHFTLPRWAAAGGGWLGPRLPERFAGLAARAATELGDLVDLWATINEPTVLAFMAYGGTRWPPGLGRITAAARAAAGLLDGHARAYHAMHRARPGIAVGLVLNAPVFAPDRGALDRGLAALQDWSLTGAVLHALATGWLLPPLVAIPRRVAGLAGSLDLLGLNYYGRYRVAFDPRARATMFGAHVQTPTIRTEWNDWGQPHPDGLAAQLARLARLGVPLYVTENGVCDATDALRPRFLVDHLRAVRAALAQGVDVRGYFHWSLIDNFEWAEGWSAPFGLVALDRATGARTPRESARVFERICRTRRLP